MQIKKLFLVLMIISIISISLTGPASAQERGDFVILQKPFYYVNGQYEIKLTNLTLTNKYAILIGSNLEGWAQEWINFTATSLNMQKSFSMDESHMQVNSSRIGQLKLELYDIETNVLLSTTYLYVRYNDNQIPFFLIPLVIAASIISLVVVYLIYLLIKKYIT